MANEQNLVPFKIGKDPRREGNGRKKGYKTLTTIIRELENEKFNWDIFKSVTNPELHEMIKSISPMGSPFRALVMKAFVESLKGNVKAMEFLRKAGYGDKLDVTSKGKRIKQEPVIISTIKKRDAQSQTETEVSS